MAPDRGRAAISHISDNGLADTASESQASRHLNGSSRDSMSDTVDGAEQNDHNDAQDDPARQEMEGLLAERASHDSNFTLRGVMVGSVIGIVICFSNAYFGLQTGWISGMAMPAALMGFAWFKSISPWLHHPFSPVENVLVQTVAGAVGTMPLGVGAVGVIPALNFLLKPSEGGPLNIGLWKLMIWSVGISLFGCFVAIPLRKQVIIREKLPFPSGTATALMIGVLHGGEKTQAEGDQDPMAIIRTRSDHHQTQSSERLEQDHRDDWKDQIRLLVLAFGVSAIYTLCTYFIPVLHRLPIFGLPLAQNWLWTLNPSPAYVGQGIIMGPTTTTHMLIGALLGWAVLSPLAKAYGWAPGPVSDWETGSQGWIVWISLTIMLADSLVNIGWLVLQPISHYMSEIWLKHMPDLWTSLRQRTTPSFLSARGSYVPLSARETRDRSLSRDSDALQTQDTTSLKLARLDQPEPDAPPQYQVTPRITYPGFLLSIILCAIAVHISFGAYIPLWITLLAIFFSLVLSLMGVRALGETDLNPVSGISKLTQLVFAALLPASTPHVITVNLLAGAISESAALQAGDMMQDLKAGHLLGASPRAQFYGQLIGSVIGAVSASLVYKLYTHVYTIPGGLFEIPTAYVWIFTARLVTGQGLPAMAWPFAVGAGMLWTVITALRIAGSHSSASSHNASSSQPDSSSHPASSSRADTATSHPQTSSNGDITTSSIKILKSILARLPTLLPGGIAVAVGMYNTPSFTLARFVGGMVSWYWARRQGTSLTASVFRAGESPSEENRSGENRSGSRETVVVLASGLILGEGVVSIVNLVLASLKVPHL